MVVTLTGQILVLASIAVAGMLLHRLTRLDLTLSSLLCGFLTALSLNYVHYDTGLNAYNLKDLVFFVILPVLIFEAAWNIKPALLRRWLPPILLLATVGILISTGVTAAVLYWGIGHVNGFPWIAALLAGGILAATDPVAVVSQLRENNAPEDLATLFEGESLFNDASAVVLFSLLLGMATHTDGVDALGAAGLFGMVFFGGIAVGVVCGLLAAPLMRQLGKVSAGPLVILLTAFGSFYIAEHLLHVSGILAVMVAALMVRTEVNRDEPEEVRDIDMTWEWLGTFFNSLLFVMMGMVITLDMFVEQWLAMLIAIAAALLGRAASVVSCSLATQAMPQSIGLGWQLLLFWGGLRGAIAVALVLALPVELDYWYTVQSMVFGVVLFSLLVQGTSNSLLISRFGSPSEQR